MTDTLAFTREVLVLDSAQAAYELNIAGHFFQVFDVSSSDAEITVHVNTREGRGIPMRDGMGWTNVPFNRLYFEWSAQAGKTLTVLIAGNPADARPELVNYFQRGDRSFVNVTNTPNVAVTNTPNVNIDSITAGVDFSVAPSLTELPLGTNASGSPFSGASGVFSTSSAAWLNVYTVPSGKKTFIRKAFLQCSGGTAYARIRVASTMIESVTVVADSIECFSGAVIPDGGDLGIFAASGTATRLMVNASEMDD